MPYTDLETVAAAGDGTLWRLDGGMVWSAKGAQPDNSGTNLRIPAASVDNARVQAALAEGAWVPLWVDQSEPPVPIAVARAPIEGAPPIRARTMAEFGTVA